jgi:hypothetical protein
MSNESTLGGALNAKQSTNADVTAATEGGLMDGEEVRFNARIPKPLRDAFSDLCDRKGRTMSSVVQEWMIDAVKEGEI